MDADHWLAAVWAAKEEKVFMKKEGWNVWADEDEEAAWCIYLQRGPKAIAEKPLKASKLSVEGAWQTLKDTLLKTLKEKCQTRKHRRGPRKLMVW